MIRFLASGESVLVQTAHDDLVPRHEHQLAYWGIVSDENEGCYRFPESAPTSLLKKVTQYLERRAVAFEMDETLAKRLAEYEVHKHGVREAQLRGKNIKEGILNEDKVSELHEFLQGNIPRKLKDHQYKAALHLLAVQNGANFSVPGSGKTTVVLAVFAMLQARGMVDSLFVVGPPSCFGPWRDEFEKVLGRQPSAVVLAGGGIEERRSKYVVDKRAVLDLYLTSFQTLARDYEHVCRLFRVQGIRFFLVVDEAHYIKQVGGSWAKAVLDVSPFAARRCILTGTPFPRSYTDAFNLFDVLWPDGFALSRTDKRRISIHSEGKQFGEAATILNRTISGLFYRVRKSELGLAPQEFRDPIVVPMRTRERTVYDAILDKIELLSDNDYLGDMELLSRLRRGRMMRLRQCVSYTKLLLTALPDYREELIYNDKTLARLIQSYDEFETPAKLSKLIELVDGLRKDHEKVVIWSNFVETLKLIRRHLTERGYRAEIIYGGTPLEREMNEGEALTRERIIRTFLAEEGGLDVLIANPAACAESISLHKNCSNAIYYDLSYNCAQYLQSLDRIHRVGGSEDRRSHYYFLQYYRSLDQDILENVRSKAERMGHVIDQDYPIYSLDMFDNVDDDDEVAYMRLFRR